MAPLVWALKPGILKNLVSTLYTPQKGLRVHIRGPYFQPWNIEQVVRLRTSNLSSGFWVFDFETV